MVAGGFRTSLWARGERCGTDGVARADALSSDTGAEALMKFDRKRTPFNFFRPAYNFIGLYQTVQGV